MTIENAIKSTLTNISNRIVHTLNNTISHFQAQPSAWDNWVYQ
jgi:hypothetical protein